MKWFHVPLYLMRAWVHKTLEADSRISAEVKSAWMIVLNGYLGYCAKELQGEPTDRVNGETFWKNAVPTRNPEAWQKKQWGEAMAWFFRTMVPLDQAGPQMRTALRLRHVRYSTEKSYLSWIRRFQAFCYPRNVIEADETDAVSYLTHLAEVEEVAASIEDRLRHQVEKVRAIHPGDTGQGFNGASMSPGLIRKYKGRNREFFWQYVFPAKGLAKDPRSGQWFRHHVLENSYQVAITRSAREAQIQKHVTSHALRHSFATH